MKYNKIQSYKDQNLTMDWEGHKIDRNENRKILDVFLNIYRCIIILNNIIIKYFDYYLLNSLFMLK